LPLSRALQLHAAERPDAPALAIGETRWTYGQLWRRSLAIHGALAALPRRKRAGDLPQDLPLFVLSAGNHPAAAEFLATALAHRCCVALLDPAWPVQQQSAIIERLCPDIVVCISAAIEDAAGDIPVLRVDDQIRYEDWLSNAVIGCNTAVPEDTDPFLIGFTSGTTSMPKAFLRNRGSWRASAEAGREHFSLDQTSNTLAPGPLAHGLTLYAFMETLEAGATFYGLRKFDAAAMADLLTETGPDRLVGVPTMLEALYRIADERGVRLPSPRRVTTAGAKLEAGLLKRLSDTTQTAEVTEYYGASELGFVTTTIYRRNPEGQLQTRATVSGRPFPGVQISIRENGTSLAAGEAGAIFVKSPLVIDDYLPGGDGSGFRRDGDWASVGDIGRLDGNGCLTLLGRSGGMVITGGHNVYPDEIAGVLAQVPGVKEALVIGVPDPYLGQALVAVMQFETKLSLSAKELAAHCAKAMPRYKVPRRFFDLSDWPMTGSGKIATGIIVKWIEANDERLHLL